MVAMLIIGVMDGFSKVIDGMSYKYIWLSGFDLKVKIVTSPLMVLDIDGFCRQFLYRRVRTVIFAVLLFKFFMHNL